MYLKEIAEKVINNLFKRGTLDSKYQKELNNFEYSRRKLFTGSIGLSENIMKKGLIEELFERLKNNQILYECDSDFIGSIKEEMQKQLILAFCLKLDDTESDEKSFLFKDFKKTGFIEKKGVLLRNSYFGESDLEIVFSNIDRRLELAIKNVPTNQKDLLLKNIASYVVNHLLDKNEKFKMQEYSRRKISLKEKITNIIYYELQSALTKQTYDHIYGIRTQMQIELIDVISKKLESRIEGSEKFILFKNWEQKGVFETKGVLLRNILGKNDFQIVTENITKRIEVVTNKIIYDEPDISELDLEENSLPLLTHTNNH